MTADTHQAAPTSSSRQMVCERQQGLIVWTINSFILQQNIQKRCSSFPSVEIPRGAVMKEPTAKYLSL
jgi:hypothetical protein